MSGGITAGGFELKTLEQILDEIGAEQLATIDPALDISPDQPLGQMNGIVSKKLAEIWEALAVAYNGFNRAAAEGGLLESIGLLTGTTRLPATKSRVLQTVNLDATTTLPAGSVANVVGQPTVRFASMADVTSTTAGNYYVEFQAEVTGPVVANAGTLTVITTPVAGWNSTTNALDAVQGTNLETDVAYRLRQQAELAASGSCTVDSIRADLLRVDGVIEAFVFENTSLVTNVDGVPGKAYECVIYDGASPAADDQEIGQVIWDNKPSGILTYGDTDVTVQDSTGEDRTVSFSRATPKDVYLTYTLNTDADLYPIDGDDQVKAAAVAKGSVALKMGVDVIALVFRSAALSVAGVIDVTDFRLGFSATPTGTSNLTIASREIAVVDTSRIVVA